MSPRLTRAHIQEFARRHFPTVAILLGVLLLAFVGMQYGQMYYEQRRLAAQWESENLVMASHNPGEAARGLVHDGLTKLLAPKIELDAIVVEGTTNKQLLLGPGRILKSALPGEHGNAVITAHRDTFFRRIVELGKGDEILVRRQGKVHRYEVTGKKVVKPTDVWVLKQTDEPQLTLITCYPTYYIGPAPERLVVFSSKTGEMTAAEYDAQHTVAKAAGAP